MVSELEAVVEMDVVVVNGDDVLVSPDDVTASLNDVVVNANGLWATAHDLAWTDGILARKLGHANDCHHGSLCHFH